MKRLMSLMEILLEELGGMMHTSTERDWKTVTARVEDEGLSFLTITLPTFNEAFQLSLDEGRVVPEAFTGFKTGRGSWLPLFLGGFTEQVFDRSSGVLLDIPNPDAIRAVRQFTLFVSKILVPCSDARNRKAVQKYVECEQKVRETDSRLSDIDYHRFRRTFQFLFGEVCQRADEAIYNLAHRPDVLPKHGPGATADRLKGNQKWQNREWTERLEQVMPAGEMLIPSWRYNYLLDDIDLLEPGKERPVRVILVPKTLKTPRIIAVEPTAMQYAQQAVAAMLMEEIGLSPVSPMIGFDDQAPNQRMAEEGSLTGELATLDLSSASDLVSNQLVIEALRQFPNLSEAVQACRSLTADVPGVGVIPLAKYASMGSALTFPLEAMVFLTVTIMGVRDESRTQMEPISRSELKRLISTVRVYGDDIICPRRCVSSVISYLELYGFEVGLHKSFWTGSFRESCGKEYFMGHDVSIVKCRRPLPSSLTDVDDCISAVSLRNQLYQSGLWKTAAWLDDRLDVIFKGRYPTVVPTSSVLGRHSFLGYQAERMHPDLHAPLVKGYVVSAPLPKNPLDGEAALLKFLTKRGDEPYDSQHLERSGRPSAVRIKLRWQSPF